MHIKLLHGMSAYRRLRWERTLAGVGWASFAVGIFAVWLGSTSMPALIPFAVVAFLGGVVAVSVSNSSIPSIARQNAEERAGYTTIPEPYQPELDLVDPATGEVIRARGAAPISREQFEERLRAGRS